MFVEFSRFMVIDHMHIFAFQQSTNQLPPARLLTMLRDIAEGMNYLSDLGYVHRVSLLRGCILFHVCDCFVAEHSKYSLLRELQS